MARSSNPFEVTGGPSSGGARGTRSGSGKIQESMATPSRITTSTPSGKKHSFTVEDIGEGKVKLTHTKDNTSFNMNKKDLTGTKVISKWAVKKTNG